MNFLPICDNSYSFKILIFYFNRHFLLWITFTVTAAFIADRNWLTKGSTNILEIRRQF